jgi:demethylmenaquinone methyltransferase/2-methoxy-6-polyprenyl-1,4-benzoquinol methylase
MKEWIMRCARNAASRAVGGKPACGKSVAVEDMSGGDRFGFLLAFPDNANRYYCVLPHPTLATHYATPEAKPGYVNNLFDKGAKHYDGIVDWGFLRSGGFYRRWVQKRYGLKPGHHLLDVACGTGLVAVESAKILGSAENITCLDPSEGMLAVARTKLAARFVQARAEAIPLPDNSFDFLTMGYALRHVTDLELAFREYRRVLRPGGRLLILEVTKPTGRMAGFLFRLYFGQLYPWLTQIFTRSSDAREMMRYYWETMDACVPPAVVLESLRLAGFAEVKRNSALGLFSEYSGMKT